MELPRQIPLQRGADRPQQIPLQRQRGAGVPPDPAQRGARPRGAGRSRYSVELQRGRPSAWSCPGSRSRYSVELTGSSVELPPADPATAWSSAASAWSCPQQIPLQRGAGRLQRGADPSRSRFSVELGGLSVELPPADPATAWSSAASAWSCPQQIPLQRGAARLQRGAAPSRSRFSVGWAAPAWSSRQQIPLQRGAARLQRGVPASRPRFSVELRGFSVEFRPADPATAWSCAASAWSLQAPPAWRSRYSVEAPADPASAWLQRGVPASRPRYSVELGGFSVEFPPADPATAWSSAASAWSCRQQTPLQRGAAGFSVELPPTNPATAWSCAAPAGSSTRSSVESPSACQATDKTGPPRRVRDAHGVVFGWFPVVRSAEEERRLEEPPERPPRRPQEPA